ncbi:LysR family transcriptional regulator [Loktanella sp. IMCC34160]|uniref:LysR family transcriptional regulator n=1 Tax=Loktanella sp. IMCC34160 TaxID=2510646 RepID=UPI00101B9904|nr:LysR family transcriptional regulator [Loktanella sp. IMCC34160]RYG91426.1 LysR family transcriptional regulator [Loktanella sp. IMCC34160]
MSIKLEMLRVFRIVADQGSLAGAAARLGRTPSAISMTLSQLEAEVGAPLFETDRKNRLTKVGALVLEEAVRTTDVFESCRMTIQRLTASIAGTVRIAAVPSAIATILPNAIAHFQKTRPDVRLEISDLDSASVRRRVRLDEADIGILTASEEAQDNGLEIETDPLGILYRADGPIDRAIRSGKGRISWAVLRHEPLIANPLCAWVSHPTVEELREACNLEARNTTALISFVREGLGATILPQSVRAILPTGLLLNCPDDPVALRTLRMISNPDRRLAPAAQEFWSVIRSSARSPDSSIT